MFNWNPTDTLSQVGSAVTDNSVARAFLNAPESERLAFSAGFGSLTSAMMAAFAGERVPSKALAGALVGALVGYTLPKIVEHVAG